MQNTSFIYWAGLPSAISLQASFTAEVLRLPRLMSKLVTWLRRMPTEDLAHMSQ